MLFELTVFLVLVVIPVAINIREVPDRLRDLRAGAWGLVYVPGVVIVLFAVAIAAWLLSRELTFLQWGWLGQNIIAAPISDLLPASGGATAPGGAPSPGGGGVTGGNTGVGEELGAGVTLAVFVPIMVLALLLFNFYEEAFYRDSLKEVVIWAVLHLVMGIPLFAVIPIFAVGLVYKLIRDRRGVKTAYVTHFATNLTLISLMVGAILLGPPA